MCVADAPFLLLVSFYSFLSHYFRLITFSLGTKLVDGCFRRPQAWNDASQAMFTLCIPQREYPPCGMMRPWLQGHLCLNLVQSLVSAVGWPEFHGPSFNVAHLSILCPQRRQAIRSRASTRHIVASMYPLPAWIIGSVWCLRLSLYGAPESMFCGYLLPW